jgi:prepilin-type N-terminal cleavage/methylation domain-containing protein
MMERIRKAHRAQKDDAGFTLIELLIVIVILGILAAIVVFAIGKTRGDSVASACKTNYKSVELSAEAIKTKTGKYPAGQGDLVAGVTAAAVGGTDNGALLKVYPVSSDYSLVYASAATPPTTTSGFTLVVKNNATPVAVVGAGAASAAAATAADCDSL